MSAAGYTTIYNEVLRDRTLSLEAKGLFAVIKSLSACRISRSASAVSAMPARTAPT